VEHLGHEEAILVLDEAGDLKKGHSVGVQRQYTGTAGRIENSQVAVYLTYAAPRGHAFIDRALYLPKGWANDAPPRAEARVPTDVQFATKPGLAAQMITRAAAGVPASWWPVTRSTEPTPRCAQRSAGHDLGYVLQIAANRQVPTAAGPVRVDQLAARLPNRAWHKRSAGAGSKGHRY
jgi:SRSO17 transposase